MEDEERSGFFVNFRRSQNQKGKRQWERKWIQRRREDGSCVKILSELRSETLDLYKNFLRMNSNDYDYLVSIPLFQRQ